MCVHQKAPRPKSGALSEENRIMEVYALVLCEDMVCFDLILEHFSRAKLHKGFTTGRREKSGSAQQVLCF